MPLCRVISDVRACFRSDVDGRAGPAQLRLVQMSMYRRLLVPYHILMRWKYSLHSIQTEADVQRQMLSGPNRLHLNPERALTYGAMQT